MQMNWKKVMAGTLSVCMLATCVPEISELGSYAQTDKVVKAATEKNVVSGKCGKKANLSVPLFHWPSVCIICI